jgi:hypothetical protein
MLKILAKSLMSWYNQNLNVYTCDALHVCDIVRVGIIQMSYTMHNTPTKSIYHNFRRRESVVIMEGTWQYNR